MTDEPVDERTPEGPRRRTYEPPSEEAVFTGSFPVIEDATEPESTTPLTIPEPPVRTSLPEAAIVEQFRDGSAGGTTDMMAELERQVFLKEDEEEAFTSWAQIVRNLRGAEAEPYIARQRIIFDGGDPSVLEEEELPEQLTDEDDSSAVEDFSESVVTDTDTDDDVGDSPAEPEADSSESADLSEQDEGSSDTDSEEPDEPSETDHWPLDQSESPEAKASSPETPQSPGSAQSLPLAAVSWWGLGLPVAAVMTGGYLSFRTLGILESFVVLGALALVTGIMVGVVSHQGFLRGLTAQEVLAGSFGRRGAVAPALIIALLQSAAVTVLLWWASDLLVDIIRGAGLWPYERWIGQAGAWAVLIAVTAALTLVGPRVLRGALFAGSGAALITLALVVALALPSLDASLDWSWSADWMTVVSAGSALLSLATLLFVFSAADVATLTGSSQSRGGGVLSAIVLTVPMLALAGVASWMAQSSPVVSLGLLANPVGVFTDGAPAFYPSLAIVAVVVPLVGLASLLTRSASLVAPTLPLPGPTRVHAAVVLGFVLALGSLALVFALDLLDVAADLVLTIGVIVAALGAILAKEWAVMGPKKPHQAPTVRVVPLVAFVVAVAVGLGLVDSGVSWLAWQGYLFPLLDMAGLIDLSPAAPGVLVSFVVAGIISGIGAMAEWFGARKRADVDAH